MSVLFPSWNFCARACPVSMSSLRALAAYGSDDGGESAPSPAPPAPPTASSAPLAVSTAAVPPCLPPPLPAVLPAQPSVFPRAAAAAACEPPAPSVDDSTAKCSAQRPLLSALPPAPAAASAVEDRFESYLALSARGHDFTATLRARKDFGEQRLERARVSVPDAPPPISPPHSSRQATRSFSKR